MNGRTGLMLVALAGTAVIAALAWSAPEEPPQGPFGLSMISTETGKPVAVSDFYMDDECALCHRRQFEETEGTFHSNAHHDPLYRAFAELARKEAGEEVYAYCTGCHSPVAVVSGLVPGKTDEQLPEEAKAGVTCDVCHQISRGTGFTGPWGEPGNASFTLSPGRKKYGRIEKIKRNPAHTGEASEFYGKSEYCAGCHTIIHPMNGLRIEHTFDEWKKSVYAEKGIQCQDCHMRVVADAVRVADTMKPVRVLGKVIPRGPEREITPHYFVGGNVNTKILTGSGKHGRMAAERLKSAATLTVAAPETASAGSKVTVEVVVTNVAAGHNLPTSLTELREMWVEVKAVAPDGQEIFVSGDLDENGDIRKGAIRFGAIILDAEGKKTHRPWEAVSFGWKRTVPPKGSERDSLVVTLPEDCAGAVKIEARLLYRSAAPAVVREVMGDSAFEPEIVEMTTAAASVRVE